MATMFRYKATDPKGRVSEGTLQGASRETVIGLLRRQGLIPIAIESSAPEAEPDISRDVGAIFKRVRSSHVMEFTREMAVLLDAGLTIEQALQVQVDLAEHPGVKKMVAEILEDVRAGRALSEALARQKVFGRLYAAMIRAGEGGGALEAIIQRLAVHLERINELKGQVIGAMFYPILLMLVGIVSVAGLMIFIVPRFAKLFAQKGAMLPTSTRLLMWISDTMAHYWWVGILFGIVAVALQRNYVAKPEGRLKWDRMLLRIPLLGALLAKSAMAHVTRTLGMLLNGGVSVLSAIQAARQTLTNEAIAQVLDRMADNVRAGESIAKPMADSDVIPTLAARMVAIGEESAHLEEMLFKVADTYEKETSRTVNQLVFILGPAMIVMMAAVILFVVVSIFTAIYSMNSLAGA